MKQVHEVLKKSKESAPQSKPTKETEGRAASKLLYDVKKSSANFRNKEDEHQPGLPGLSTLPGGMLGSQVRTTDARQADNVELLISFCEHAVPVKPEELRNSFRIFTDSIGQSWKCFMPLTCDHAVVINGTIISCRVRSREIQAIQAGGE